MQSVKTIKPARDWKKLLREGKEAGYRDARSLAVFIADNTTDRRADGPNNTFATGYHAQIEAWIQAEENKILIDLDFTVRK